MTSPLALGFFTFALASALFTLNGLTPLRKRGWAAVGLFFAGWLVSELPLVHAFVQIAAAAVFVRAGALHAQSSYPWAAPAALGITALSVLGLVVMMIQGQMSSAIVERALGASGEGRATGPIGPMALIWPFRMRRPGVEVLSDIPYGPYGRRNFLDLYRPSDPEKRGRCPVVIQIHGGAWIIGDKERQGLLIANHLAERGFIVVSINYRLSPRSTFPDHIVDVKRAIAWVRAHIAEYGGDASFLGLTGGSAGGHLASLAALSPNDPSYQPGFEGEDTTVSACAPFYGVYDFTNRTGKGNPGLLPLLERQVIKKRLADAPEVFDKASPMGRVGPHAPPFCIVHGVNDTLVPVAEARELVDRLKAASTNEVLYLELPWAQHAFEVFGSVRAIAVVRGVAAFFERTYRARVSAGERG